MNSNSEDQAIARLKASKHKTAERMFAAGEQAGVEYVLNTAEYPELERLSRWHEQLGAAAAGIIADMDLAGAAAVMSNKDGNEDSIVEDLRDKYGDDVDDSDWVRGFVAGVLERFAEIRPKL